MLYDAQTSVTKGGRLPTLDGWRAVAILLVLFDHGADPLLRAVLALSGHAGAFDSQAYAWLKDPIGRGGVHIFFALSGYLITQRLIEEERYAGRVSLAAFYLRRLLRIQPAAVAYLLVVAVLAVAGLIAVAPAGWLAALFAAANFTMGSQGWYTVHFWSLAVEEHFYLLWPLLFVWLGSRGRLAGAFALAAVLALWLYAAVRWHIGYSPYMWVRSDIEGGWLMWGCVAALVQASPAGGVLERLAARPLMGFIALPLALLGEFYSGLDWDLVWVITVLTAAATPFLFLGTLARPQGVVARVLELAPLAWLGRISYSLYLWQELFFVWDDERSPALRALQAPPWRLALALGCAYLSYRFLERPLIRAGARWLARRDVPAVRRAARAVGAPAPRT